MERVGVCAVIGDRMGKVSLIFKDPTIGNNINISVVKLIIMSEDEDAGIIFPSASKTLRNFCQWQQELNDPQGYYHDTAILLTSLYILISGGSKWLFNEINAGTHVSEFHSDPVRKLYGQERESQAVTRPVRR
ncbi:a disintegrin and metalloproteinase with thrombospondin motifs 9 [Trichonephila clavata]|uniref:A disintegrin and metalloproteinase with thrombospondin motifs 9 n=1 Tax=Trichonephila clavata TaxID=2740835 RepID=A0A8X6F719_TRICU|nr:a disintegrin and metalloproteinase with thrombospondin motifs 9 [Trichonephila clavata]